MKPQINTEEYFLERCRNMVEEKLGWGSSNTWSHADFLEASEKISEDSGITLSVTTIKRIWGKIKYQGTPTISTLNSLAIYLGFDSWRSFKQKQLENIEEAAPVQQCEEQILAEDDKIEQEVSQQRRPAFVIRKRKSSWAYMLLAVSFIILFSYFSFNRENEGQVISEEEVVFYSEPVTTGLPNTVVFNYDLSPFSFDSAFIQQNWDSRRRKKLKKENNQITSVYYFPGHFNAKLVINDKVVKEHGLLIPTEGWLGYIEVGENVPPVYFKPAELLNAGTLHVLSKTVEENNIVPLNNYHITYSNARNFGVDGDDFILETVIKNDVDDGGLTCQESFVYLDGETGIVGFSVSAMGCVGNISLVASEAYLSGNEKDLSAFGVDLSDWVHLKCIVKDKEVGFYINQKLVYTLPYTEPIGNIMGINFRFQGAGSVDNVRITNGENEVVFEDDFNGEEKIGSKVISLNDEE